MPDRVARDKVGMCLRALANDDKWSVLAQNDSQKQTSDYGLSVLPTGAKEEVNPVAMELAPKPKKRCSLSLDDQAALTDFVSKFPNIKSEVEVETRPKVMALPSKPTKRCSLSLDDEAAIADFAAMFSNGEFNFNDGSDDLSTRAPKLTKRSSLSLDDQAALTDFVSKFPNIKSEVEVETRPKVMALPSKPTKRCSLSLDDEAAIADFAAMFSNGGFDYDSDDLPTRASFLGGPGSRRGSIMSVPDVVCHL